MLEPPKKQFDCLVVKEQVNFNQKLKSTFFGIWSALFWCKYAL